jgi:UDP-N-acetylmuramoyl-L-alanyl-D-glutamate--2,6-diaminopimelate ligase
MNAVATLDAMPLSAEDILRAVGTPRRLVADSRRVEPGDAFAACPGERTDGRRYIGQAIDRGAAGVLWEPASFDWAQGWRVANVAVRDLKRRLAEIADVAFGHPSRDLWVVGVTGTNGKTSCSHWIAEALAGSGRQAAVLGTLGNGLVGRDGVLLEPSANTTMDGALLHETFARLRRDGACAVAMEVSSHGLDQHRVDGTDFDVALFTNLSRDHLDYHRTMEAYAEAKARLFDWPTLSVAVINVDDPFGAALAQRVDARGCRVIRYGLHAADVTAASLCHTSSGIEFVVRTPWGEAPVRAPLFGTFNVANLLGVIGTLGASGLALADIAASLARLRAPAGRMQRLGGSDLPTVVIDYAHSPDALAKVLGALRPMVPASGQLVCVFGCGGDRDPGKRPQMGQIAEALADRVVITSDNPRSENPVAIIAAIRSGLRDPARATVEPDRAAAIADAVAAATLADVVLIAGKGHEDYQEVAGVRHPFSDRAQVEAALARRSLR